MKKHFPLISFLCSLFLILFPASCDHSSDPQVIDPPPTAKHEPEPPIDEFMPPSEPEQPITITRTVTIEMFDSGGNGWDGNGALRINVNGTDIATVKVNVNGADNTPIDQKRINTYAFQVATGDVVQIYWITGTFQGENSFIAYYTDTPPFPAFNTNNNLSWSGLNALIYRLRKTMDNINDGELLGLFTVK